MPRLLAFASLPVSLLAVTLLPACQDEPTPIDTEMPFVSMHGTPCEVAAGIPDFEHTEDGCNICLCEGGSWQCEDTGNTCGMIPVSESSVELLVVVDDSSSMGPDRQARLSRGVGALLEEIDAYPYPVQLRVGITTTDLGNPACDPATADDGALQLRSCQEHLQDFAAPAGPTEEPIPADAATRGCTEVCELPELRIRDTAAPNDPTPRARPWLERYEGQINVEGATFEQALSCALPQGLGGCDFESPLQAARRALERGLDPSDPAAGFGTLGGPVHVLVVTDEADCSANEEWLTVFDPEGTRRFWSDPTADAPTSAVCWNTGTLCEGGPGTYDSCEAIDMDTAEHLDVHPDNAVLLPVADIMRDIRSIGQWDARLSLIGGVPEGYAEGTAEITYTDGQDDLDYALRYGVGPGCDTGTERAVPPARMLDAADTVHSVCADDYGPAMAAAARSMLDELSPNCFPSCVALEPECLVVADVPRDDGGFDRLSVPQCEGEALPQGAPMCFELRHGDALSDVCAEWGFNLDLVLRRAPEATRESGAIATAWCRPSDQREVDCPQLP